MRPGVEGRTVPCRTHACSPASQGRGPSGHLNLTGYFDGSDPGFDADQARSIDSFERVVAGAPQVSGSVEWRRGYRVGSWGEFAYPALLAGAAGVLAGVGMAAPAVALGASALLLGVRPLLRRSMEPEGSREPTWFGTRRFTLDQDRCPGRVDSTVEASRCELGAPSAERLGRFFADSMSRHAGAEQVLWVDGHGFGDRQVASMPTRQLATAMGLATEWSGIKPDVLVLNSCLMGNLETLTLLQDRVDTVVASELPLYSTSLEGGRFIASASTKGLRGPELAFELLELSRQRNRDIQEAERENEDCGARERFQRLSGRHRTLSIFDTHELPGLLGSLDELGTVLRNSPETHAAAQSAKRDSYLGHSGFYDVGVFLARLRESLPDPTSARAAAKAEEQLGRVVVGRSTGEDEKALSGLSFRLDRGLVQILSDPLAALAGAPEEVPRPGGWESFVQDVLN